MKATVIKGFRDIKDFSKMYKPGDEVDFDESRIEKCVSLGLVKVEDAGTDGQADKQQGSGDNTKKGIIVIAGKEFEKSQVIEALKGIEVKVAGNIGDTKLVEKIGELSEEDMAKLQKALGIDNEVKNNIVVAGQKVEKTKVHESLKKIGVEVADDIADDALIEKLNELDEEQAESLKQDLGIETEE